MTIHGSASAIICCGDKILLFHRDNIPTIPNPDCWQFPGGGIEEGESPLEALRRELSEEVTFVPKKLELLFTMKRPNNQNTYVYTAFVTADESKLFKLNPGEGQEIGLFTLNEMKGLKLTPKMGEYLDKLEPFIEASLISKDFSKLKQILENNF